ncbi:MAG: alpha/beta fold hydrolase [Rhodobacteraceae bacterium]|nr:alpha/beta fold hydrolase [Paracoccaceae bacterium]
MRTVLLFVLTLMAACAVREQVDFLDGPAPGALWRPVLVATTRGPDPTQPIPGWSRDEQVTYGRYTVSIPSQRELGEIPRQRDRASADPARHFMLADAQTLSSGAFRDAVRANLSQQPPTEQEAVIFVHGFNTAFIEGVYRTAQLANDLRIPGVMLHYSWPSLGAPLAYAHDRDSALFARDGFIDMLHQVRAAGPRRIIVIGHSMGAHLVMESLRQMALTNDPALSALGGVFLISPDVDIELFRRQVHVIGTLPQPFVIITSQRDRVLTLSARLTGQTSRLGNIADARQVEGLGVTLLDVSAFGEGAGHFTVGSSPALIGLLDQMQAVNTALAGEASGSLPLLPATILTLQNTTQVILQPMTETRPRQILPWWRRSGEAAAATP